MSTRRRVAAVFLGVLGALVVLIGVAILVLTNTDWGREQVRRFAVRQLETSVDGEVRIGRVEGNLLSRIRLVDVSIVDTEGRPFVKADTIATRFSLRALFSRRIRLSGVALIRADVVLDRPPDEEWNFVRIFVRDEDVREDRARGRWGQWIELRDISLIDSRVTMRTRWEPPPDLSPAQREEAIREALAGRTRDNVVRVPGGFQNVMFFWQLDASLPRVLVAHPDTIGIPIDIDWFTGFAQPFNPPPVIVRGLAGSFRLKGDSLLFRNVTSTLPGSRFTADGYYDMEHSDLMLRMEGAPAAFADLRWLYPPLPREGGGSFELSLRRRPESTHIVARNMDLRSGTSELAGDVDILIGDTVRVRDTNLRFNRLDTRLIDRLVPQFEPPRHGRLTGHLALDGTPRALQVDGDVTFDDYAGGSSRILADGGIGAEDDVRFRRLELRFRPLQASLARAFVPELPLRGSIVGTTTLTGVAGGLMQVVADLTLRDPQTGASRVLANGGIDMREELRLRSLLLRFDPLRLDLLRDDFPQLPPASTLTGRIRLDGVPRRALDVDGDLVLNDPATGISRVEAAGGIEFGDVVQLHDMQLQMNPLQLDLLRPYTADLPAGATAEGPLRLDGPLDGLLQIDGNLVLNDPATGISRVAASGGFDITGELRFRDVDLRFSPLQMSLARALMPDLPLGGTLEGTATVDGVPARQLTFDADLVHREAGEESRVTGRGVVVTSGEGRVDVDLQLQPLSMQVVGRFFPGAGLRGEAFGSLSLEGRLRDLRIDADLRFPGAGELDVAGRLGLAGAEPEYDLQLGFNRFNAAAVTNRAPAASMLSGMATAVGRGFDPATMRASFQADLRGSAVDGFAADELQLRMDITSGLATFQPSRIRIGRNEAEVEGSFGLIAGRQGELAYRVTIDSLHTIAPWVPLADTGVVARRPAPRQEAIEAAARDLEAAARDRQVEYLATGKMPPPVPGVDVRTITQIPRDSLAGSLRAEGTLRGNVERFDAEGTAVVEDLLYYGNRVGSGEIAYSLAGVGTDEIDADVDASLRDLIVEGYEFDAAELKATVRGGRFGEGEFELALQQDDQTDLELDAAFALSLEQNELRLRDLELRVDTLVWRTTGPAEINWSGRGVRVERLELANDAGGRIFVDGDLPIDGPADLDIEIRELEVAYVLRLLQEDLDASGVLSLDARVRGTAEAPVLEGEASIVRATYESEVVPDARLSFQYADLELRADGVLIQDSVQIAVIDAQIPIDLSLADGAPRLLEDRPMRIEIQTDELDLGALPAFAEQFRLVDGVITGHFTITGTPGDPQLEGEADVSLGSLRIEPLGIDLEGIEATMRTAGGALRIDTLIAYSGGPIRISGDIRLPSLTRPEMDLKLVARDAWVIDTRDAHLQVDADLTIVGPYDALEIEGEVRTLRGVIYVPELAEFGPTEIVNLDDPAIFRRADSLLIEQRAAVSEQSTLLSNLRANINVQIERDVWLRSSETNIEIYTPLDVGPLRIQMTGLQDRPTIFGTINTDRGEYEFLTRRFRLTRGAITFQGRRPIDPLLQIAAEHEVQLPGREPITIRIVLGGTLEALEINLESNAQPPIAQSDLIAFLAFGQETSALIHGHGSSISGQGSSNSGLVGNVAGLAMQQFTAVSLDALLSGVESDLGRDLGLDVFRITPATMPADLFSGSYLDVLRGTEIELGSYITSRLFVSSQVRPALTYPGLLAEYRTRQGFEWSAAWRPRFIPTIPTLRRPEARTARVFGSFLFREWRF